MKGLYQGSLPLVRGGDAVSKKSIVVAVMGLWTLLFSIHYLLSSVSAGPLVPATSNQSSCNSVEQGYQCFPQISRLWGHYSPYFSLEHESTLSTDLPTDCQITLVQVLSRHGARFPTDHKGEKYSELVAGIQRNATSFPGKYAFLESYHYTLGEDDLTTFGQREMMASGTKFYRRYADLARRFVPFIRASGSSRVVASGEKFIRGYQQAKKQDSHAGTDLKTPIIDVVIREGDTYNDTLDHGTCTTFESSELGDDVKANFTALFAPSIRNRLEADLPGVSISDEEVVYLMDLCPFDTVAATSDASQLSPFCALFTHAEWEKYNYLQSLSKYYGYGAGNPLGPAQGIGFTNELIARLTQSPVHDHTSSNSTLDEDLATFPLNATMYADFSHDNAMTGVFFALGLYNGTSPLSQTAVQTTTETDGFSASWTVPFGARTYVEMMQCRGEKEPLVRVLVNDRVVPLHGCKTDELGRCGRADFIQGLSFARDGGNWGECFA